MKTLFITGTDTGVGKTLASAILCRELMSQGYKVGYMKPVQTGCYEVDGQLVSPDAEFVKLFCGNDLPICCPYTLKLPASPHLAAAQEDVQIMTLTIANSLAQFSESKEFDYIIAEGAGGLAVPLNDDLDMAGLCTLLQGELILVTSTALGTLNHTKLTVEYAKSHELECSVIISGCSENPDIIEEDNIKLITEMVEGRVIAKIPYVDGLDTESKSSVKIPKNIRVNF
ncbi:MAG: dethiobiotin synthase [Lentisphaeraceae bacterium]|nr:dethiobiotin synthase [Lentisphaeraceae bacterium]